MHRKKNRKGSEKAEIRKSPTLAKIARMGPRDFKGKVQRRGKRRINYFCVGER